MKQGAVKEQEPPDEEWKLVELEDASHKIRLKEQDPFESALIRKALMLPRPPALLLAKAIPRDVWLGLDIISVSGESLGKVGDFMINSATIHECGAILTDRVEQVLLEQYLQAQTLPSAEPIVNIIVHDDNGT